MFAESDREFQELRGVRLLTRSIAPKFDKRSRDPKEVADLLQVVNDYPDWESRVGKPSETVVTPASIREELVLWQKFDQKFFPEVRAGNYTSLPVPAYLEGFNWPVVAARSITTNMLFAKMAKEFRVYSAIGELDAIRSDRTPISRSYIALFRDRVEADEEMSGKSADMLSKEGVLGITLLERLRLGFFYWFKTGSHLDAATITYCAGSRGQDGSVPGVRWGRVSGGMGVDAYGPDYRYDFLRTRTAVF